jgi:FKBP-type peptidyl-prolyl cis-trans isomerase
VSCVASRRRRRQAGWCTGIFRRSLRNDGGAAAGSSASVAGMRPSSVVLLCLLLTAAEARTRNKWATPKGKKKNKWAKPSSVVGDASHGADQAAAIKQANQAFADAGGTVTVMSGPSECGRGSVVGPGDQVAMHYTGSIHRTSKSGDPGKQFDSSRDRGETFDFRVGQGDVIQGWDKGLLGLCQGAKAELVVPPALGYGDAGAGAAIPGGATLLFEVEVVRVGPAKQTGKAAAGGAAVRDSSAPVGSASNPVTPDGSGGLKLKKTRIGVGLKKAGGFVKLHAGPPEDECPIEKKVKPGDAIEMHWVGHLLKSINAQTASAVQGKQFADSRSTDDKSGGRLDFRAGGGQLIDGWDDGIIGLCEGNKAELIIPAAQAYKQEGNVDLGVPPNADIRIDVEILSVAPGGALEAPKDDEVNAFWDMDFDANGKIAKEEMDHYFLIKEEEQPEALFEYNGKDKNGAISWLEFKGPKGTLPPNPWAADEKTKKKKQRDQIRFRAKNDL